MAGKSSFLGQKGDVTYYIPIIPKKQGISYKLQNALLKEGKQGVYWLYQLKTR